MAVRIRLKRTGRRNRPFYRICVFDSRTRRDGKPIEELGSYDPRGDDWTQKVKLKRARAHHWLTVGALPSETVGSILRRFGVRKDGPVPEDEPEVVAVVAEAAEVVEESPAGESDDTSGEPDQAPSSEPAS
ncbi:MAG: 30S ribosomal protein S16 [Planctomycetota bacterium]|nr:30S ribosomal protein S16 [Planctomycetota bacterium]